MKKLWTLFFCVLFHVLVLSAQSEVKTNSVLNSELVEYISRSQNDTIPVWIFFTDKGLENDAEKRQAVANVNITSRAMRRRAKVHKKATVQIMDVPVNSEYIKNLETHGLVLRHHSKWLNAVSGSLVKNNINTIAALDFVKEIKLLHPVRVDKSVNFTTDLSNQLMPSSHLYNYGTSVDQLDQINVPVLHDMGYSGKGILIGILDSGFNLHHDAYENINVIDQYDFIFNDNNTQNEPGLDVDSQETHGSMTLSVIGGSAPGELYGPAFGADFILAKTEDMRGETSIEEDNWVAGLEWMEALGVDIVNSSLGYLDWYTYPDMDGNTAVTTIAADIAASMGVIVCNSAGNERSDAWYYIDAPADADSIITVGAINRKGKITSTSSAGPTYDGRIKPEVVALGDAVKTVDPANPSVYKFANGTSFASPLVAGVCALLLEAHPLWGPMQVREALMNTASNNQSPDNLYGWGIVNALSALDYKLIGDVNGDDVIDDSDVLLVTHTALEYQKDHAAYNSSADVNRDGEINVLDVLDLLKLVTPD